MGEGFFHFSGIIWIFGPSSLVGSPPDLAAVLSDGAEAASPTEAALRCRAPPGGGGIDSSVVFCDEFAAGAVWGCCVDGGAGLAVGVELKDLVDCPLSPRSIISETREKRQTDS